MDDREIIKLYNCRSEDAWLETEKQPKLRLKKLPQQRLLLNKKQSYPCKKGTKNIKSSSVMPVRIFYYYLCCNNLFIK